MTTPLDAESAESAGLAALADAGQWTAAVLITPDGVTSLQAAHLGGAQPDEGGEQP